jgi:hypothetical protein
MVAQQLPVVLDNIYLTALVETAPLVTGQTILETIVLLIQPAQSVTDVTSSETV